MSVFSCCLALNAVYRPATITCSISAPENPSLAAANFAKSNPAASRPRYSGDRFSLMEAGQRDLPPVVLLHGIALVNVAAAIVVNNGVVERSRIACGAVSAVPRRLLAVEEAIKDKVVDAEVATVAGRAAIRDARPLNYNGFKIPLMASLVTRAVRDAASSRSNFTPATRWRSASRT